MSHFSYYLFRVIRLTGSRYFNGCVIKRCW